MPKVLMEHRSMSKLKSTYTDRLPEQIKSRLSATPSSADDIQFIHERIPESDGIIARLLTACLEHHEAEAYAADEWQSIEGYFAYYPYLDARFKEIKERRKARKQEKEYSRLIREAEVKHRRSWDALIRETEGAQRFAGRR